MVCSGGPCPLPTMEFREGQSGLPSHVSAQGLLPPAMQGYGERSERLMRRLERLRRRLHEPTCPPACRQALQERIAWLHGAIFAISSELDGSY